MKLLLEDCTRLAATNVRHLADHVIRFQLREPRGPSPYQRLVLEGRSDTNSILPDAPNREAVRHNFTAVVRQLETALSGMKNGWFSRTYQIRSTQDLMRFHVDHCCRPTYLYTNGQAFVTLVARPGAWFEIAHHPSTQAFETFNSEYGHGYVIAPEHVSCYGSLAAAELFARRHLSQLEVRSIPFRKDGSTATMLWQRAGDRTGADGYPELTYIGWFRGETFGIRIDRTHEPYQVLRDMKPDGFRAEACATCLHFRFSGMSRDMSGGEMGYCRLRPVQERRRDEPSDGSLVSVFDVCPEHAFASE